MRLSRYSLGVGDRFGRQGTALLEAFVQARDAGSEVTPVWNKSHREHAIIGTDPASVREEADASVRALGWSGPYHVDADHIGLETVDAFLASSDFFTIDVAHALRDAPEGTQIGGFQSRFARYSGPLAIPGIEEPFVVTDRLLGEIAGRYLPAIEEAGKIHRRIVDARGAEGSIVEVSMDEADRPQAPIELLFILGGLADEGIPVQTIAPRFSGRFNKGVDYEGDIERLSRELEEHIAVIAFAVREFGLPSNLKLSVHSGSDKFSIYAPIRKAVRKAGAGLHVKTAGTTWLEEVAGLAASGEDGLRIVRDIYRHAHERREALCAPYATVIDIDPRSLPSPDAVDAWSGEDLVAALEHGRASPRFNRCLRQLLHVAYRIAAEMGRRYTDALEAHADAIGPRVTRNILDRHLRPLFLDG